MQSSILRNIIFLLVMFCGMLLFTIVWVGGATLSADADTKSLCLFQSEITLWDKVASAVYGGATLLVMVGIIGGLVLFTEPLTDNIVAGIEGFIERLKRTP